MKDEIEEAVQKRADKHLLILYGVMLTFVFLPFFLWWLVG